MPFPPDVVCFRPCLFIRLSEQILLPRYLMNGLSNLRAISVCFPIQNIQEYLLALTDDLV